MTRNYHNTVMKKLHITFFLLLLLFAGCKKEPLIPIGFDSPIDQNAEGQVTVRVLQMIETIGLTGRLHLYEGEVLVQLINPAGESVYSNTLVAPVELEINEMFEAKQGIWKLKYRSFDGLGTINLRIR